MRILIQGDDVHGHVHGKWLGRVVALRVSSYTKEPPSGSDPAGADFRSHQCPVRGVSATKDVFQETLDLAV